MNESKNWMTDSTKLFRDCNSWKEDEDVSLMAWDDDGIRVTHT